MKLFYLFLLLLPFQFALNIGEGADVAVGRVIVLLLIFFVFAGALRRKSLTISFSLLSFFLFSFLFWSGFSLLWADAFGIGFRKFIFLINFIPLFWCIPNLTKLNFVRLEKIFLYPALIVSFIGTLQFLAQFFIGTEGVFNFWAKFAPFLYGKTFASSLLTFNSWLVEIGGSTFFRALAFFPDPHIFGFYLAFVTPLALLSEKKLFRIFGGVLVIALLLTFSRQAYIGALSALMVWFILNQESKGKGFKFLILFFILYSLFFIPLFGSRFLSSFDFSEGSIAGRFENWSQALALIKDHPLIGVGLGNYASSIDPQAEARAPIYAHNLYLDIAAELGSIGLILFLGILFFALRSSFRKKNIPVFFTLIWFSAQAMFDTPLFSVHILPLLVTFLAFSDSVHETA